MKNLKWLLTIGASLALLSGCAMLNTESAQQTQESANKKLVGWKRHLALAGIQSVDRIDVNVFDPRDPVKPSWWPATAACEHPFPIKGSVKSIDLKSAKKSCRYEFDGLGRLRLVIEASKNFVFDYPDETAKAPERISLGEQSRRLKFDRHGNLIEEATNNATVRNAFGKIMWPDRIVVTTLAGDDEMAAVVDQKFYDLTGQLVGEVSENGVVDLRVVELQGAGYRLKIGTGLKDAPDKIKPERQMTVKDGLLVNLKDLANGEETPIRYRFDTAGNWITREGQGARATRDIEYY